MQSKLLEAQDGKRLNTGTTQEAIRANTNLETVEGQSTGPRTAEGKARVSRNGYKGGARALFREYRRTLRSQDEARHMLSPTDADQIKVVTQ